MNIRMESVHTFGFDKRQADIILLFEYICCRRWLTYSGVLSMLSMSKTQLLLVDAIVRNLVTIIHAL